jgi:hypothetical protein
MNARLALSFRRRRPSRAVLARFGLACWLALLAVSALLGSGRWATAADAAATKDITFDDVKLDLKTGQPFKRALLTPAVKKLDGTPVRIRGYILPSFQQTGIKQFVLVRDNMQCCFGPGAALHDCILVEMSGNATADFTIRPVSVAGTFSVREVVGPDGAHLAIYHLDGTEVK